MRFSGILAKRSKYGEVVANCSSDFGKDHLTGQSRTRYA